MWRRDREAYAVLAFSRERRGTPHAYLFCTSSSPVHSLDLPEIARRRTPLSPAAGYPGADARCAAAPAGRNMFQGAGFNVIRGSCVLT